METQNYSNRFVNRHIGPRDNDILNMLKTVGADSIEDLIFKTIPDNILLKEDMKLDEPLSENEYLAYLENISQKNKLYKTYIGTGYYNTFTPSVIVRNILENAGWYTQYTPYQAEISQGRLEALLNFQTMVSDLTGMSLANASLLDEGTAAAEAMGMFFNLRKGPKKNSNVFFVSEDCFPQTIDVLKTRAIPLGIELKIGNHNELELTDDMFGLFVQYPANHGQIYNYKELFEKANSQKIFCGVAADILSLALLTPPGEFGADAVVGSTQRFGVPLGYGGPHAGYFATKEEFKRNIPGRIIGVSLDSKNRPALRMALQTREQHIKREKATSNICTAQVLLAIMAGMYAVYHGSEGVKEIATLVHKKTVALGSELKTIGVSIEDAGYFDTIKVNMNDAEIKTLNALAIKNEINFRYDKNVVGISIDETTDKNDLINIVKVFAEVSGKTIIEDSLFTNNNIDSNIPKELVRETEFLTHEVFNSYQSETEMMRYIKSLENKDLSLTKSMIPLGSCTMKLNAASEMFGITKPGIANLHPFVPLNQAEGYKQLFDELECQLKQVTGFAAVSFQPNSGAAGEYAGLMVIKQYQKKMGEGHRNVCIIPSSAHGTNPASAVMAGNKVIIVKCDDDGNIVMDDLKEKAEAHKENLSAIMVTYPSTYGVFEETIKEICDIIHSNGGQVYMDGANMNAQVGLTSPYEIGADVCHLNLHKTFCIPHGGGGPGAGPIGVAEHLVSSLPGHTVVDINKDNSMTAVSAAPWGSASILPISYGYIKMMGTKGLMRATQVAILNANYVKERLKPYFKILFAGKLGFVAHELIFDLREFKNLANVEVEDVAKRLMDYGYHAPTVSFPVGGTFMVEPTESESKEELDRFCDTMISIRKEIEEIENGTADKEDNVLKNSPHTSEDATVDEWTHSYSRTKAVFPLSFVKNNKFWPSVGRVNNAHGDRNLICSCIPVSAYEEE